MLNVLSHILFFNNYFIENYDQRTSEITRGSKCNVSSLWSVFLQMGL